LTTETIWDDVDIVHVLREEIVVPNFHTYGGIRLPEDAAVGLEPDGGTPACQKTATAGSPDIAVYTAFIVIATLEAAFLTFEHTRSQPALAGVEKTE